MNQTLQDLHPSRALVVYTVICFNAFAVGGAIMAFEMVSSRFISPYFGGSIFTWASIISVVLCAMALGYVLGGVIADRVRRIGALGFAIVIAGLLVALTPTVAASVFPTLMTTVEDVRWGSLLCALMLLFIPTLLLAMHSPFEVRVVIRSFDSTGRVVGVMNGIATLGAIVGTLGVSFFLIPHIGSTVISYGLAGVILFSGLCYLIVDSLIPHSSDV